MYKSDRWVTPGVVIVGIVAVAAVVLGVVAAVTYLADRGIDPDPMLRLVAQVGSGAAGVLSLLLQLINRRTVTKTERNTGVLADAVYDVADALPRPVAAPAPPRHAYGDETRVMNGAAPGPRGS